MALPTNTQDHIWRAALSEFFSTLIFVFAASGSAIVVKNLSVDEPTATLAVVIANAFALSAAVSFGTKISSGHVNPAVTFAGFVGGELTWLRCIIFWLAQLLGSVIACLLLKFISGGQRIPDFERSSGIEVGNAVMLDIGRTFAFVSGVHRIYSSSSRNISKTMAFLIGLVVGANYLWVRLFFDGVCMNPAALFGPSLVGWSWENHRVYWDLAFDLSLSTLLGDNVYNFGELLAHPIVSNYIKIFGAPIF
ncbi:aquaporin TIP1-1 [Vigna radiata var. radiata]|uniref:Aquaporin TIP1-1 n=1 Tax=Vigna radiata var. radiata TaxID=3916 RepID=A0A1S3VVZ2_VIGRR|nr:aquaporin TIP1-1 [Vigna radiata var. radiata]